MVKRLQLIILAFVSSYTYAQTTVSFSVQAHQDDWQLFMSSRIMADLSGGGKVVFITLTAGDAGEGTGSYSPNNDPYYTAREKGSVYSSKLAADIISGAAGTPAVVPTSSLVSMNGHNVRKYVYGTTIINYFLRLPDGNGNGNGFTNTGFKSLERLKSGAISTIAAIDGSTTYTSWNDLILTIRAIVNTEKIVGKNAWLHTAHTITGANTSYNDNDHSDHRYSSLAAQDATSIYAWVGVNGFMDYASSGIGANLSASDHENAVAVFSMCTWGLTESLYHNDFNASHKGWIPMDDFQVIKTPVGTARPIGANEIGPLTEIPIIISAPASTAVDEDITMSISPYESGELTAAVYDMAGKKLNEIKTLITNRNSLFVTLKNGVSTKGTYKIETVLNNQFIDTRKITVE